MALGATVPTHCTKGWLGRDIGYLRGFMDLGFIGFRVSGFGVLGLPG